MKTNAGPWIGPPSAPERSGARCGNARHRPQSLHGAGRKGDSLPRTFSAILMMLVGITLRRDLRGDGVNLLRAVRPKVYR